MTKYVDGEDVLVDELLVLAQGDLKASLTLSQAKNYRQSIFFLQQAVEKTFKALGKYTGLTDDVRSLNHTPLKAVKGSAAKSKEYLKTVITYAETDETLDYILKSQNIIPAIEYDKIDAVVDTSMTDLMQKSGNHNQSAESLQTILSEISLRYKWCENALKQLKAGQLSPRTRKQIESIFRLATIVDVGKHDLEEGKAELFDDFAWTEVVLDNPQIYKNDIMVVILIDIALYIVEDLAIITSSHVTRTRYCDEKENFHPEEYYTEERPLVKIIPELQKYAQVSIDYTRQSYEMNKSILGTGL